MPNLFGSFFSHVRRTHLGISLRRFCDEHGFDPGNISKLERGILLPPQSREKIAEYADALGLKEGSDEWIDFFDRAAASRGELPEEIIQDDELASKLPLLFRTLRGDRVSDEDLRKLAELLLKS